MGLARLARGLPSVSKLGLDIDLAIVGEGVDFRHLCRVGAIKNSLSPVFLISRRDNPANRASGL